MTDDDARKLAGELSPHIAAIGHLFNQARLTKPQGFSVLVCYAAMLLGEMAQTDVHRLCTHFGREKLAGHAIALGLTQAGPVTICACLTLLSVEVPKIMMDLRALQQANQVATGGCHAD